MPTSNKKRNWTAWALKFIGSLIYLYIVSQLWTAGTVSGTFGPILFGLSVVFAVALFLSNLAVLVSPKNGGMNMWMARTAMYGGFALLASAYTLGGPAAGALLSESLIGFIIAYIGSGMDMN